MILYTNLFLKNIKCLLLNPVKILHYKHKYLYLFFRYGYHYTLNSYYLCYDPKLTDKIFNRIRSFKDQPNTVSESYNF